MCSVFFAQNFPYLLIGIFENSMGTLNRYSITVIQWLIVTKDLYKRFYIFEILFHLARHEKITTNSQYAIKNIVMLLWTDPLPLTHRDFYSRSLMKKLLQSRIQNRMEFTLKNVMCSVLKLYGTRSFYIKIIG